MLVQIVKDWEIPNLMRQSPNKNGEWGGIKFTLEPVGQPDYLIILNRVPQDTITYCPQNNIWAIIQEPPIKEFSWLRRGFAEFARVYTTDNTLRGQRYILSQPCLPWHIGMSYDELKKCSVPDKERKLSWITSNSTRFRGHRQRLKFLSKLQKHISFDLWGRGFLPISDKWDGLAPYRYSLAVENYHGPFYWSEKLADCFLSWTMPIYSGCTNILDFFPAEAMVLIDINDPDAIRVVREAMHSDLWLRNRDAIEYARQLVLDKYQFFPFVAEKIRENQNHTSVASPAVLPVQLHHLPWSMPDPAGKWLRWQIIKTKKRLLG